MKLSDAWALAAEQLDGGTVSYTCVAAFCLYLADEIDGDAFDAITERITEDLAGDSVAYRFPPDSSPAQWPALLEDARNARVLACLMFAEEARSEGR